MDSSSSKDLHSLISKEEKITSTNLRHLKGNWLAYWEHEIGRSEKKDSKFNLKQIKLQAFSNGHTASVKSMFVLDNENSFLSASRDRTVKVWSIRSQGDGSANIAPKWTYSLHKKSVFSVHFMSTTGYAVSCDSNIHIWDPFVGSGVCQVDGQRLGGSSVQALTAFPAPSPLLLAATHDSMLHMIDARMGNVVSSLKVAVGSTGLVRSLASGVQGLDIIVGHSSGFLSIMDIRVGKLKQAWKVHYIFLLEI